MLTWAIVYSLRYDDRLGAWIPMSIMGDIAIIAAIAAILISR